MSVAKEWEFIESNTCEGVKLPSLTHKKGAAYSEEEVAQLLKVLEKDASPDNQLIVKIALITGCRAGEIAALEAKHLDSKTNTKLIEQAIVLADNKIILKKQRSDGNEESPSMKIL